MVSWGNIANAGNSALSGYQAADNWMAARRERELQQNAAKAYGEAMMKMSQPQPWRVPMSNDYTPPPPAMTMPNFMQAMPKGLDPAAMGMAADRFMPIARNQQLDDYRDSQIRLGQQRATQTDEYRDNQIKLGQERNNQSGQRIDMARERMDALSAQNEITNKFRDRALQLQALGLEQRNPQAAQAFKATQSKFIRANDRVTSLMRMIGDADRNLAMGVNRDIYDARTMELNTALKAAMSELDAVSKEIDQYDVTGQGLPQPSAPQGQPPAAGAQPPAAAPGPQIPPKALEILRSNPGSASQFEKTFGLPPGGAQKYMQGASLDGGMGADMMMGGSGGDMMGQGGPEYPMNNPQTDARRDLGPPQTVMSRTPNPSGGPSVAMRYRMGPKGALYQTGSDGRVQHDLGTGAPLLVQTGMATPAKRAVALAEPRSLTGADPEGMPMRPGMYPPGQSPQIMPQRPAPQQPLPDAQMASAPRGESLQPFALDQPAMSASEAPGWLNADELRSVLQAKGVSPAALDGLDEGSLRVKRAMLDLVDETKPFVETTRAAANKAGELRRGLPAVKLSPAQDKELAQMQTKYTAQYYAEKDPAVKKQLAARIDALIEKRARGQAKSFKGS